MSEKKSTVDTQHPDYTNMVPQWKKCRAAAKGQRAIHEAGTDLLSRLSGQTDNEYNAYKGRAQFFNATWATIKVMVGMLLRKPPTVKIPKAVEPFLRNITTDGRDFTTFCKQVGIELETIGRIGIINDCPSSEITKNLTVSEAEMLNLRPSMNYYRAESIINWKTEKKNNQTVLTMVVLVENASIAENKFGHETEKRYRVLELINGVFTVSLYKIVDGEDILMKGYPMTPLMNNKPLPYIPFNFVSPDDTTPDVEEPPLMDLIDANIAWYKLDADLKHGLHFTGLPTPWTAGYTPPKGTTVGLGSTSFLCFPDPTTTAGFLEFTGQGLNGIIAEKDKIVEQMAVLGSRHIGIEKKDTETAQTAEIHRAGEDGSLSAVSVNMSKGLTSAMRTFCAWAGKPDDENIVVEINKDFIPSGMTSDEMTAWVSVKMSETLSPQVVFWNMKKKEMVPEDLTFEQHQAQLSDSTGGKNDKD